MTTIEQAFEDFHLSNQADGLTAATLRWYQSILAPLVTRFAGRTLSGITTKELREYIVSIRERDVRYKDAPQRPTEAGNLARETIDGHIRAMKRFFSWCAVEYDTPDPTRSIKRPKPSKPQPKAIDQKDFLKLWQSCADNDAGIRDRALLAVLADTGVRLQGLLGMTLTNTSIQDKRALVTEKGNKTRWVYFTNLTARLLFCWLAIRQSPTDSIWVSMTEGTPLTASGVHEMLKRLKERAGVRGRVNPHSFRHNFAREYIRNGGDIVTLAKLLGHSSVETTAAAYALFNDDELQEFHAKHTPLKGLE